MVLSTLYWTTCIVYAVYIWRVKANMIVNFVPGRVAKYRNQYLYLCLSVCSRIWKTTCTKRSVFCACTRDVFRSSADNTVGYTLHTSGVVDEWGVAPSSLIGWATALTLSSFTMAANSAYEKSSILCCPCNDCTMCIGLVAFTRLWCVLKVVDMPETRSVRIYISTVVLIGCVASRPVIGWRLFPSNSTQTTDGCGVYASATDIGTYTSCCISDACKRKLLLLSPTLPTTIGPIYYQRQAGTKRSDTAALNHPGKLGGSIMNYTYGWRCSDDCRGGGAVAEGCIQGKSKK